MVPYSFNSSEVRDYVAEAIELLMAEYGGELCLTDLSTFRAACVERLGEVPDFGLALFVDDRHQAQGAGQMADLQQKLRGLVAERASLNESPVKEEVLGWIDGAGSLVEGSDYALRMTAIWSGLSGFPMVVLIDQDAPSPLIPLVAIRSLNDGNWRAAFRSTAVLGSLITAPIGWQGNYLTKFEVPELARLEQDRKAIALNQAGLRPFRPATNQVARYGSAEFGTAMFDVLRRSEVSDRRVQAYEAEFERNLATAKRKVAALKGDPGLGRA